MKGPWLAFGPERFRVRIHLLAPVAVVAFHLLAPEFAWRYVALFGLLALHELGHAVAARACGARRAMVSLWPWFGRADVEVPPGVRVAVVALAGPAVNLAAAGALLLLGAEFDWRIGRAPPADFAFTVSLVMGCANLVPVPPADGGRALRALRAR